MLHRKPSLLNSKRAGPKVLSIRASGIQVVNVSACSTRILHPTPLRDVTLTITGTERVSIWFEMLVQGPCFEWWMLRRFKMLRPVSVEVISAALGLKDGPSVCLFKLPYTAMKQSQTPNPINITALE